MGVGSEAQNRTVKDSGPHICRSLRSVDAVQLVASSRVSLTPPMVEVSVGKETRRDYR